MTRDIDDRDRLLDRILDEIRQETPGADAEREITSRVWNRLGSELAALERSDADSQRIGSCADFQGLLASYSDGTLAGPRRLLVEDHLGECVTCRRAWKSVRRPRRAASAENVVRPGWASWIGWRTAAAAVIVLAVIGLSVQTDVFSFTTGGFVRVKEVEGELFRVGSDGSVPLAAGDELVLAPGEEILTAKGSRAVLELRDASVLEVKERSQLALGERRHLLPWRQTDGIVALDRGSVIVEAADQGSGHLYVDTDDCRVAVTGTVFSVNHGMKGSRVSVLEGAVEVAYAGGHDVLRPGEQTTTHPALSRVPVEDEIAWSANVARYRELLREVRDLGREMDAMIATELRRSSDLLPVVPRDTVVFAALPNLSGDLGQAYEVFRQRLASSEILREWWNGTVVEQGADDEIDTLIEKIRTYGSQLGQEIVIALSSNGARLDAPVLLARVPSPDELRDFLGRELEELNAREGGPFVVLLGDDPAGDPGTAVPLYLRIDGDLLVAAPDPTIARSFAAAARATEGTGFADTAFHARLSERYDEGVEWLVGVDLSRVIETGGENPGHETFERLGLLDVQHLVVESERRGTRVQNEAMLTFAQDRRGIAAWLAPPAPMGSLEYVSPDAHFAAGFVMKDMSDLVDETFELIEGANPDGREQLARFETEQGIDVRRDFAATLGGEFAIALDGPVLPSPSLLVVVQVYDAPRLEQTLEWTVGQLHDRIVDGGGRGLELRAESIGDRTYHRLESLDTGFGIDWVFDDGYLLAAPSRVLLDRALQTRAAGVTLPRSARFQELLPEDGRVNFSAAVFQHLGPVLGPLSRFAASLTDPEHQQLAEAVAQEAGASLTVAYGEPDRIVLVGTSEDGLFGSSLGSLLGLEGAMSLEQVLGRTFGVEAAAADGGGS
jgi:hypothetical protein